MKFSLQKTLSIAAMIAVAGCASSNIKSYRVDQTVQYEFKMTQMKPIHFKGVTKTNDDHNSIDCRMGINIYLPQKMTYSQYVDDAFKKTLFALGKADEGAGAHEMKIALHKVDFSSVSGKWYIEGDVLVETHKPVHVKTESEFGTSYVAESACQNTADAFDEAVKKFIKDVLTNPHVAAHLK